MADILDDSDWDLDDDDLDEEVETTGESTNQPEFGVEDEELDEDDMDADDDLTEDEILRRAVLDDLEEAEDGSE